MVTFNPNIYIAEADRRERTGARNMQALQSLANQLIRQENLKDERLRQDKQYAQEMALKERALSMKEGKYDPSGAFVKASMGQELTPEEKLRYQYAQQTSGKAFKDEYGNLVTYGQMPSLPNGQPQALQQPVQQPEPQQLEQEYFKKKEQEKILEKDANSEIMKLPDNVLNSPSVMKKRAEAMIDFESQKALQALKGGEKIANTKAQKKSAQFVINRMNEINEQLKNAGAIVSEGQDFVGNIQAMAGGTGAGQVARKAFSPETQKLIDEYRKLQSTFLPFYASAAGLGAKSLDSEGERKSILDSFGDPTGVYEANKQQLENLSNLIGEGGDGKVKESNVIDSLPEGARQIGTSGGKPVYQTPDGKRFIQE